MSITPILEIVKKGGHSKDLTELELANIVRLFLEYYPKDLIIL